jgi:hypothetical protein
MLAFVVGIVVVLLLVIGAVQLFSGGDDKLTPIEQASPPPSPVAPSPSGAVAPPAQVNRKSVTVAVLNGTTTNGLARGAANRLQRGGYRIGQVTNATDNSRSATSVSYAPGFRRAGLDVARVVRVPSRSVRPIDAATRVIAGEDALVVVTVGSDQSP